MDSLHVGSLVPLHEFVTLSVFTVVLVPSQFGILATLRSHPWCNCFLPLLDYTYISLIPSARMCPRFSTAVSAVGFCQLVLALLVLVCVHVNTPATIRRLVRTKFSPSIVGLINLGSTAVFRRSSRVGFSLFIEGCFRTGSCLVASGYMTLDTFILLRVPSCLDASSLVLDSANLTSTPSLQVLVRMEATILLSGICRTGSVVLPLDLASSGAFASTRRLA